MCTRMHICAALLSGFWPLVSCGMDVVGSRFLVYVGASRSSASGAACTAQAPPSRHLALGNLLPGVARSAIELAFGQYGELEGAVAMPHRPPPGGGGGEAHLTFRDASTAVAAQRSLHGAFIPSLTGALSGAWAEPMSAPVISNRRPFRQQSSMVTVSSNGSLSPHVASCQ